MTTNSNKEPELSPMQLRLSEIRQKRLEEERKTLALEEAEDDDLEKALLPSESTEQEPQLLATRSEESGAPTFPYTTSSDERQSKDLLGGNILNNTMSPKTTLRSDLDTIEEPLLTPASTMSNLSVAEPLQMPPRMVFDMTRNSENM